MRILAVIEIVSLVDENGNFFSSCFSFFFTVRYDRSKTCVHCGVPSAWE